MKGIWRSLARQSEHAIKGLAAKSEIVPWMKATELLGQNEANITHLKI